MANKTKFTETLSKDKSLESAWVKVFKPNAEWPDKEEFLDVVYWMRQLIGIALGLVWGLIPLKGFFGLFLFVATNAASVYIYVGNYQKVDEEEYGGMWEITKEGFVTSFAGFLVSKEMLHGLLYIQDCMDRAVYEKESKAVDSRERDSDKTDSD